MTTILYIEDNEINAQLVQLIVEREGYPFMWADGGKTALNRLKNMETLPDIILMDIHLPGMSGVEIAQAIKSNPDWAHIPIIALTADIYSYRKYPTTLWSEYLNKPIRRKALLNAIERVVQTTSEKSTTLSECSLQNDTFLSQLDDTL